MKSKKLFIIPLIFIAFGVFGQEADLTLKPVAGKKYDILMNMQMEMTQGMAGMEMKANSVCFMKAVMEITEVNPNGDFTIVSTLKDFDATMSIMGKDSVMRPENLNVVMKTVFDKSGKAIRSERIDTLGSYAASMSMIEQLNKNAKYPVLPGKITKKGDTWQSHATDTVNMMEMAMAMITDSDDQYSFAGTVAEDGVEYYRIDKEGPIKISGEGASMGMSLLIEGTGMNESYFLLDKTTRLPMKIEEKVGMDTNIVISGPQSMAIPMIQNIVTTTKFVEVK